MLAKGLTQRSFCKLHVFYGLAIDYSGTSLIRTSFIGAPPLSGQPKSILWFVAYWQ